MEAFFKAQRCSTRTVLLSFKVATRLSQGEGAVEQLAAWSAMGGMPMELIEKILVFAELEIPESLRRALPKKAVRRRGGRGPGGSGSLIV
jgi:hypothetical protein